MKCKSRMASCCLRLAIVCLCLAQGLRAQTAHATPSGASTGCGYSLGQPTAPVSPQQIPRHTETESNTPRLVLVSDHHSGLDGGSAAIVGLWKVTFLLADGTVFDDGYATWHSDGTELMNSGVRAPMTGNFCMGVWKQTSQGIYNLNHVAVSWDSTGSTLVGPANIRETIKVDSSGNVYRGTFTLDQFDVNGILLAHFDGKVIAKRITAD